MNTALVLTTIQSAQTPAIVAFSEGCKKHNWQFVVAGDVKSPTDFKINYGEYLSIAAQGVLNYALTALLPYHHYSRKNLAYLRAIQNGADVIVESDDDNLPKPEFWSEKNHMILGRKVGNARWINAYSFFTKADLWPRGFSLHHLEQAKLTNDPSLQLHYSPIQQYLADCDPDIDAIQRLKSSLPHTFDNSDPLILNSGSVCPFNSQNTVWFSEMFALLYLPSTCNFRMCDIWRSFVAQRILAETSGHVSFLSASVEQVRNVHDLLNDLEQESEGYVHNTQLVEDLWNLPLEPGMAAIEKNLLSCYELLVSKKYLESSELALVEAWLRDINDCKITPL